MENLSTSEQPIEGEAESNRTCPVSHAEVELPIPETNTINDDNVDSTVTGPANCTDQQVASEEESAQNNTVSTLQSDEIAGAKPFEPAPIKEEIEDDYDEDDCPNDETFFDNYAVKEEQDVKSESDSYSEDSDSDDEDFPWDNLVTEGTPSLTNNTITGNGWRPVNSPNKLQDADDTTLDNQQGDTISENGEPSMTNGDSQASGHDKDHDAGDTSAETEDPSLVNGDSQASENVQEHDKDISSPGPEAIPRKRRKKAENESPNVDVPTRTREKRTAFKKCTEWFKHLSDEIGDRFSCPTCGRCFSTKRKVKEHELIHKSVEPPKINEQLVHENIKPTKTKEQVAQQVIKASRIKEQPVPETTETKELTVHQSMKATNIKEQPNYLNWKPTKMKKQVGRRSKKPAKTNEHVNYLNLKPIKSREQAVQRAAKASKSSDKVNRPVTVMGELSESQNGGYDCDECHEVFSSKSGLSRHQRRHGEADFFCGKCHAKFFSKNALLSHMEVHLRGQDPFDGKVTMLKTPVSRIRKFKCDGCEARFTQRLSLEQHELIHKKKDQDFECKECGKMFTDVSLLAKHQESHAGQKSYGCGECDERFTKKSALFKHQLTHVERRKAECTDCKAQFADRSELKIHHLTVHGTENLCVCTQCNKKFSKQASLKRHLLTHSEEKRFKCSICKEIFAQKSTLTRHALLHGGEQFYRFVCSVCDRKFSRRETLTDHMRTHTGERPFVCAVCHEGFTQKSAMRRHQILHFKERRGKNSLPPVAVDTGATEDILLSLVYSDP